MIEKFCYTCAQAGVHIKETDNHGTQLLRCETCGTTSIHQAQPLSGPARSPRKTAADVAHRELG